MTDQSRAAVQTAPPKLDKLPPYAVLLHNDTVNDMAAVVEALMTATPLKRPRAVEVMLTAHNHGKALIAVVHKELAELYRDRLRSMKLSVTIEKAE